MKIVNNNILLKITLIIKNNMNYNLNNNILDAVNKKSNKDSYNK